MAAAVETVLPAVPLLSKDRVEPGSNNIPLGEFPPSSKSAASVDPDRVSSEIITWFNHALAKNDLQTLVNLFLENGYWRDHLCLSWDLHTLKGRAKILRFLQNECHLMKVEIDKSTAFRAPHVGAIDSFGDVMGIEFFIKVVTVVGSGQGLVRLAEVNGEWKIFTFFTSLRELTGHEERTYHRRPKGVEHGGHLGRRNWQDCRDDEMEFRTKEPAVLIVGAGQAGLTAAARLKMLGVDTLVVDQEDRIGDSWRRRYHQLVLHDPVWFDHMPYIPFPPTWPIFTPKDKLGEFFESYVKLLELNVWTKTTVFASSWDDLKRQWTVVLTRQNDDGTTATRTVHPRHIIQATGHSGKKNAPTFKGMENFRGDRICHSSEFSGALLNSNGKKAIVIGSCNSGHDIAQDFYENGYDVTMVQRSSTCVVSSEAITEIGLKGLYDENGPPFEDADLYFWGMPTELFKAQQVKVNAVQNKHDAKILEGLQKAGFMVDKGPDDCGLFIKYFQRGGGYYIDVGASQLIIDGKVKVKQGQEISAVLPHGLRFADGTELEADEIVFATGYQNMRTQARIIFGDNVASKVGDVWGFDEEGEMRTIWRRSGHPGFYFMGGNLAFCRYYSRILALQIKALEEHIAPY